MGRNEARASKVEDGVIHEVKVGSAKVTVTYDNEGLPTSIKSTRGLEPEALASLLLSKHVHRVDEVINISRVGQIDTIKKVEAVSPAVNLKRILAPAGDYAGGVASPLLVEHPVTGQRYFLFTGWSAAHIADGEEREVYVSRIENDFTLRDIRRLIPAGYPTAAEAGHFDVDCIFDPYNDQWLLLTSAGSIAAGFKVALFRYNLDFTHEVSHLAPMQITPEGGAAADWDILDNAPNQIQTLSDLAAFCNYVGDDGHVYWAWTTDVSQAVPTWTYQVRPAVYSMNARAFDVGTMMYSRYGLIGIIELLDQAQYWHFRPFYIEKQAEGAALADSRHCLMGLGSDGVLLGSPRSIPHMYGHPHMNYLPDGKLNLFFALFKNYPPDFTHEIWVMNLEESMLDPLKQRAIIFSPWYETDIAADEYTYPFTGLGSEVTVYFTEMSGNAGNLIVEASPAGSYDWYVIATRAVAGNASDIYTLPSAARQARLKFSVATRVSATVVVQPR